MDILYKLYEIMSDEKAVAIDDVRYKMNLEEAKKLIVERTKVIA